MLSPGFVSITFKGEALADFTSLGFDDHVKLMFGDAGDGQLRRDYTPRRFNREARELTIEFALHGHGAASDWARSATVGQRLLVGGPRGSMIVPLALGWHLLVGDATALPAISRRLEELPDGSRAFVFVLADEADRRDFAGRPAVEAHWAGSNEELLAALEGLALPSAETGFAWGGGEASLDGAGAPGAGRQGCAEAAYAGVELLETGRGRSPRSARIRAPGYRTMEAIRCRRYRDYLADCIHRPAQSLSGAGLSLAGPGQNACLIPVITPFCAIPTPTLPPALSATAAAPLFATCPIAA
jgi:hypothetical protein